MKIATIRSASKRFIVASLFSSLMLSNCGKDSPTTPSAPSTPSTPSTPSAPTGSTAPVPSRIQITPASKTLNAIGQTLQLSASVLDANNSPIPGAVVSWTSANTAVANVNAQGLVTAVANGNAQITAQSGSLTTRVNVTVKQLASRVRITPSSVSFNEIGQTIQLSANVVDARNNPVPDATVSWTSADTTVATVSTQGLVTAVANGMTQVTARSGSTTGRVTITVMGPDLEREALVKLFNATDGPNWTNKTGWLSEAPLRSWYGVNTDENGRVTRLSLHENNLKGTLIPELSQLFSLESLALSKNQLTGNIPQELGELSQLKLLYIWGNQLTGTIPQELGHLAKLEKLSIAENRLTGTIPPEIGQLTNLTRLNLSDNMLSGTIPTVFGQLTNLTEMLLSKNELTGKIPSELGQLTDLTLLYLWGNKLNGDIPVALTQLTRLEKLSLSSNQLTGQIPPELGRLTNLNRLNLGNNRLTGQVPVELGQLTNLTELLLGGNSDLSGPLPDSLKGMRKLTELNLSGTRLCMPLDAEMQTWVQGIENTTGIANCESDADRNVLVALFESTGGPDWTDNSGWMSDQSLAEWYGVRTDANGRVIDLNLHDNNLQGNLVPELNQLDGLEFLALSSNQLSGSIPRGLGQLTNLKRLSLFENMLSGAIPPEIGQLAKLNDLWLNDNQLEGNIPPEIGQLTQLTWLSLNNNRLFGAIEPELLQLVNLSKLWLRGTEVCAPDDAAFRDWLGMMDESRVASCADVRPGYAPVYQREFDARFVGKVLSTRRSFDIEITSDGRYAEPVGGQPAGSYTYSITGTNKGRLTQIYDATGSRCIIALTFTAPTEGSLEYRCGTRTQYGQSGLWRTTNAPDPDSYNIEIVWIGEEPDASMAEAAKWAAARWEHVIIGDLPDIRFGALSHSVTVDDLFDNGDFKRLFGYVDDLIIFADIAFIDGENGSLAKAGPYYIRSSASSPLPHVGVMTLDTDDLDQLSQAALYDLILHEMGHVLGIGTLWDNQNLLENPSLDQNDEPILPPPDTHFTGMEAIEAFDIVGGTSYRGKKVPVENEEGGRGTQDSHWRDSVIGPRELMDGYIDTEATHRQPMSLITIQSLADLGYEVDETQADPYFLSTTTFARRLEGTTGNWIRLNCIVR